jgi:hypothetical protein
MTMGFFDRFGAGGGSISIEAALQTQVGAAYAGTVVFTAGKREQVIEGMKVWFVKIEDSGESILYAPTAIPVKDTIRPGEVKRFAFEVVVPKVAEISINGQVVAQRFGVRASLDIPKEIDPQGKLDGLAIAGGLAAQVTIS